MCKKQLTRSLTKSLSCQVISLSCQGAGSKIGQQPVGLMFSVPSKALMGLLSPVGILSSIAFGVFFFLLSIKFWQFALKKYTSASS